MSELTGGTGVRKGWRSVGEWQQRIPGGVLVHLYTCSGILYSAQLCLRGGERHDIPGMRRTSPCVLAYRVQMAKAGSAKEQSGPRARPSAKARHE